MSTSNQYFNLVRRYPGLVSYWRLNDPNSSTTVTDFSAHNSLVGSYSASTSLQLGLLHENDPAAGSRLFTPTSGFSVPDIAQLRLTTMFELEAWVAPTSTAQTAPIISKTNNGIAAPYSLSLNAGMLTLSVGNGSTQVSLAGPQVPVGVPSRVSGGLFRNTLYLSLNGTTYANAMSIGSQAITDSGNPLMGGYFAGLMAEVAVYNMTLSALKRARNFALGRQVISDPTHFMTVDPPTYAL